MNAGDNCNVLFVGSGSTGAIHKLIGVLNLKEPPVSTLILFYFEFSILYIQIFFQQKTLIIYNLVVLYRKFYYFLFNLVSKLAYFISDYKY